MLNFVWLVWVICGTSAWSIQARSVSARDFDAPTPQETSFTLDELGFTQDSVSRSVHIPKDGHLENIRLFINGARNHTDPKTYLTTVFPKILRIYRDDEHGYLSIDNRRLCVFKQVLGPAASIDVLLYSREDIDQLLKEEHVKGGLLARRTTNETQQGRWIQVNDTPKWNCPTAERPPPSRTSSHPTPGSSTSHRPTRTSSRHPMRTSSHHHLHPSSAQPHPRTSSRSHFPAKPTPHGRPKPPVRRPKSKSRSRHP